MASSSTSSSSSSSSSSDGPARFSGAEEEHEVDSRREPALLAAPPSITMVVGYKFPWSRVLLTVFLLVAGLGLIIGGGAAGSFAVAIVGIVLLIPGGYMGFILLQLWRRNPRYNPDEFMERENLEAGGG